MNVLFLDVDGVLNTQRLIATNGNQSIGSEYVDRLQRIVEQTGVVIVLISSWRIYPLRMELLADRLAQVGLTLFDKTVNLENVDRAEEINEWLGRHQDVERFVILDDGLDAGTGFDQEFFKTDFWNGGLTEEIAQQVVRYINGVSTVKSKT